MLGDDTATLTSVFAVVLATLLVDSLGDTADQALRYVVFTAIGDDEAQLGLEFGRTAAGPTEIEVLVDLVTPLFCELTVQVVIELVDRLIAVHRLPKQTVFSHVHTSSSVRRPSRRASDQASRGRYIVQRLLERPSSPVDATHDGADGHIRDL
jgi:hypothetical protein